MLIPDWTPAAERLPDDCTLVLLAMDDEDVWPGFRDGDIWRDASAMPIAESRVTDWMHMPAAPKRGGGVTKSKGILGPRAVWTDDQLTVLRDFYPNHRTEDLATMIGHPLEQVYRKAKSLGLAKSEAYLASPAACRLRRGDHVGSEYRFQKGVTPWNKGTNYKAGGRSAETRFAAGWQPHNTLPIGSAKLDKSGTLLQKVSDAKGNNSKRWRGVHELVWVAANGPLPAKHIVVFKPGMKTNVLEEITLDRVDCISLAENMKRNTRHNLPPELNEVVQLRAVLTRHINKRKKA